MIRKQLLAQLILHFNVRYTLTTSRGTERSSERETSEIETSKKYKVSLFEYVSLSTRYCI